ncbi:MAG: hypothetical protein NTZ78_12570 [Candidatus Aureabacteria bacterium]|nr:hypothetical protein [Candidatus Auribacterota bacterium]
MNYFRDKTLAILLLLFLATRLIILFFDFSSLTQLEELYNGTLAREMLRGLFLPLLQLRYIEYQSGSLIVSFCAIPYFVIFGQSYVSLKLVALTFSAGTFTIFYLLLRNYFSQRTALWAGLLYIFSPPIVGQLNLKVEGANSQSILITMAIWYLFFKLFCAKTYEPQGNPRSRGNSVEGVDQVTGRQELLTAGLLGALISFGIWFCPVVCVVTLCILILWRMHNPYFIFTRRFVIVLIGFFLGAIPALYDYWYTNFSGLRYLLLNGYVAVGKVSLIPIKFAELWGVALMRPFPSKELWGIPGNVLNGIFYIFAVIAVQSYLYLYKSEIAVLARNICSLRPATKRSIESCRGAFFLLYLVAFSLFYAATRLKVSSDAKPMDGYRYLVSFYPFLFILIALGMEELSKRKHHWLKRLFVSVMLINAIYLLSYTVMGDFATGLRMKGYSYEMLGLRLYDNSHDDLDHALSLCEKKIQDESDSEACIMGVACSVILECQQYMGVAQDQCIAIWLMGVSTKWYPYFYRAQGQSIASQYFRPEDVPLWRTKLQWVPAEYLSYCYQGLGCAVNAICNCDPRKQVEYIQRIAPEFKPAFQYGLTLPYYSL